MIVFIITLLFSIGTSNFYDSQASGSQAVIEVYYAQASQETPNPIAILSGMTITFGAIGPWLPIPGAEGKVADGYVRHQAAPT